MKIAFLHFRDTNNVGDRWCSPYDYFDWPEDTVARDIRAPFEPYDIGIIGGGKLFGQVSTSAGIDQNPGPLHVAWGVGTQQNFALSRKYAKSRALCDLVGSRDVGNRAYDWAPCASCMHPFFNDIPEADSDVVFYWHGGKTKKQGIKIPEDMPNLSNYCDGIDTALKFISRGRTVVSNSYHGVYWSLLMGRKVICVPFSHKFSSYPENPFYSKPKQWLNDLDRGIARPEMLAKCRAATLDFKDRVDALIDGFSTARKGR